VTTIYRIVYGGVCEILVEVEQHQITKILAATGDMFLIGRDLSELPAPGYVEARLVAGYGERERP